MSKPEPMTFDTGNPLEGYGAPLEATHVRGRETRLGCAEQAAMAGANRPANTGEMGVTGPLSSHEIRIPMAWALRPISPADETALIEFHDRCSEETHYLRFAATKPHLRPIEAHYLCGVDDHRRGALVVIESDDPGTIHGVGRWEELDPTGAELAFVIEDAYQGQGLGRELVEATIERVYAEGFTRLVTDVLASNSRMRHLARDYGLVVTDL